MDEEELKVQSAGEAEGAAGVTYLRPGRRAPALREPPASPHLLELKLRYC